MPAHLITKILVCVCLLCSVSNSHSETVSFSPDGLPDRPAQPVIVQLGLCFGSRSLVRAVSRAKDISTPGTYTNPKAKLKPVLSSKASLGEYRAALSLFRTKKK